MTAERREGLIELIERLTKLEVTLSSHVEAEDADRQRIMKSLETAAADIKTINARLNKQGGYVAGVASAFSMLIGVIIWLAGKLFGNP